MSEISKILPPDLESWIESRVARGDYVDAEDFIRDLVRREQRAEADDAAWVREMIAEGEASGYLDADPSAIIEEIIAERRARRG
jgi:antitoxin ParD1/3/4